MKLPILFVCEDNGLAMHTPADKRCGYDSISNIVAKFRCYTIDTDTTDAEAVHRHARYAAQMIRASGKPFFMRCGYYRYLEHVGVKEDFDKGYRSKEELSEWSAKDPILIQRKKLIDIGVELDEIMKLEGDIKNQINESVYFAKNSDFTSVEDLHKDIFDETDNIL